MSKNLHDSAAPHPSRWHTWGCSWAGRLARWARCTPDSGNAGPESEMNKLQIWYTYTHDVNNLLAWFPSSISKITKFSFHRWKKLCVLYLFPIISNLSLTMSSKRIQIDWCLICRVSQKSVSTLFLNAISASILKNSCNFQKLGTWMLDTDYGTSCKCNIM